VYLVVCLCRPYLYLNTFLIFLVLSTQTLAEYFKEYRSYHKLLERKLSSSSRFHEYDNHESRVEVGRASFKFHRTLRIPDDADEYLLPPVSDIVS
jgi:hypothetical protein